MDEMVDPMQVTDAPPSYRLPAHGTGVEVSCMSSLKALKQRLDGAHDQL